MTQKILVPLDGSESAEQALTMALDISRQSNSELIVLRATPIVPPTSVGSPDMMTDYNYLESQELTETFHTQTKTYLESIAANYGDRAPALRTIAELGDPATVIVDMAGEENVNLIIMSTHGHSGMEHLMLGSVTERVLHGAPCPVLVVRDARPLSSILVTLDGSELSESALAPALNTARLLNGQITLLHVEEKHHQSGQAYLDSVATRFNDSDVPVTTALAHGSPVTQILDYVRAHAIDMVVMSTHGRSGIRRWLHGSVSEKVLRDAPCAVLIVRPTA